MLHLLSNLLLPFAIASRAAQQLLCYVRLLLKRLLYSRKLPFGYNFNILVYALCLIGYKIKTCIYTAIERKINGVNLIASCILEHPKCFWRPKTTYRYPTLQSRVEMVLLHCQYIRFCTSFMLQIII